MAQTVTPFPRKIANAEQAVRHVFVRDLLLDARIGVHGPEKGRAQPVRINIDLAVRDEGSALHDSLANVVCYENVVDQIKAILALGHVNLVETLAERIAEACLADLRVDAARVRVEKLAAIPEAASVGIEIERIQAPR